MYDARMLSPQIFADISVGDFLAGLGSSEPCPGGGAAAALAGALAAALGKMVCELTIGKPRYAGVEKEVRNLRSRFDCADRMLRSMIDEDAAAYGELAAAFKLDKASPERAQRIAAAAEVACIVPLETASFCQGLRRDLRRVREIGNRNLSADVESALALARAGGVAALANARANLPLIEPSRATALAAQAGGLAAELVGD